MKIVLLDGYTANPGDLSWDGFAALGDLAVYDRTPREQIVERIGDAQAVITNKTPITREILEACPSIRYIGVLATGYNVVDVEAARERGVPVTNIPAYSTASVAQLTFALLLEICHRVGHHSEAVHAGRWQNSVDFTFWDYPLMELAGKTMGIIGFGQIGQAVGRIARAMGMQVLAHSRSQTDSGREIGTYVELEELLAASNVVSLHCPLFPTTQGIINRERIAKMKDGAILLNTSRGPLLVEQDVADALNAGKLYAAGVDVATVEPINEDSPLLTAKNCFITPHIAWAPKEARTRLIQIATGNLRSFQAGAPVNVVNG